MRLNASLLKICIVSFALAASTVAQTGSPRQETLINGLKLLMWRDSAANKVTVKIRVHNGSAFDPQGKEGVIKLLSENVFPTQEARDYFKEDLGGSIDIIDNYDYIQIIATATPANFLPLLETLSRGITNINIDKETTEKLKAAQLEKLKELEKQPGFVADMAVQKRLFGTFPYGRPAEGTSDSIARIDFADLITARERFFTADNATVAISGSFDPDLAYKAARRYFGPWLKADKKVPATFRQPDAPPDSAGIIDSPEPGKFEIRFIIRGYAANDSDFAASNIMASILEQRIRAQIPEKYRPDTSVRNFGHVLPGYLLISFSGTSDPSEKVSIDANAIIGNAIKSPITDAEFAAAKAAFTSSWEQKDTLDRWLDIDTFKTAAVAAQRTAIANIKLADVQRTADILGKQNMAVVVLGANKK